MFAERLVEEAGDHLVRMNERDIIAAAYRALQRDVDIHAAVIAQALPRLIRMAKLHEGLELLGFMLAQAKIEAERIAGDK